jgi:hypothetical protein
MSMARNATLSARARRLIADRYTPRERAPNEATGRTGNNWHAGRYDGAEMAPLPSIPPERFAAFRLPSRMGNRLYWPGPGGRTVRITDLDGNEVAQC